MPLDVRPAKKLVEAERNALGHNAAALAKSYEHLHESVDVRVSLQEAPVEPADIRVLAVRIIIASLGSAHLVTHEQHRRAG